jgi:hypothetical protein
LLDTQITATLFRKRNEKRHHSDTVPSFSLLYEALTLWITNVLIYTFNTVYADKGDEFAQWPPFIFNMVAQSLLYPFVVTSNCMAVTDSGLVAGQPDYMPRFKNWIQCWKWLSSRVKSFRNEKLTNLAFKPLTLSYNCDFILSF